MLRSEWRNSSARPITLLEELRELRIVHSRRLALGGRHFRSIVHGENSAFDRHRGQKSRPEQNHVAPFARGHPRKIGRALCVDERIHAVTKQPGVM